MRVLFFSFPYESAPGGGERYTEQTADGLIAGGHAVTLVSSSRALLGLFFSRGWSAFPLWGGVEPVTQISAAIFPLTAPVFLTLLALTLAWFRFRGARVLVCLSLTDKLLATLPARLLGMRVVWMEHLVAGRSLTQNPFRGAYAALSRLADVVTVSAAAADSLAAAGIPRGRISIVPPGISPRPAISGNPGAPVIGAISRLSREKNVALLLKAFALVAKEIPETTLRVFGDGPERETLATLAETLGIASRTSFLGHVPDAGTRCGEFGVLAVPSSRESFGLSALEAMACGTPVVAARVGGLPELIIDGETGMLVPPEDERAMADALIKILRDRELAARLGEAGRARSAAHFSEKKMQASWIGLSSPR
ncbi:MAG: glycosyltransferase family 4 protein [Patescibacteria group bacterium]